MSKNLEGFYLVHVKVVEDKRLEYNPQDWDSIGLLFQNDKVYFYILPIRNGVGKALLDVPIRYHVSDAEVYEVQPKFTIEEGKDEGG